METIYVYLLDEGTDVGRPVKATKVSDDIYDLDTVQQSPDEKWEFPPGSRVRTERKMLSGGCVNVAVDLLNKN